ncbi:hypothetical protein NPIL_475051 [Nephila pilipes]|uniref:Uncharacterized protein n=1 Tax=Nephila pilipes TaxID=299642 RepID=A0A8X6T836_NEPPI|nr:hypothetical protein NPIL_475051 [Nephila pilipes]
MPMNCRWKASSVNFQEADCGRKSHERGHKQHRPFRTTSRFGVPSVFALVLQKLEHQTAVRQVVPKGAGIAHWQLKKDIEIEKALKKSKRALLVQYKN